METPELWEKLLIGVLVVGVIFLFRPGIKATWERSKQAKKDWAGFLLPIGAMVLFIILLIYMARNH
jgi:drug/metabolite transporter (DMT)-like permease